MSAVMTRDEAELIRSIDPAQWEALARVLRGFQDNAAQALQQVTNSHEQDLYYKGGISAFEQALDLRRTAHNILQAQDPNEEEN